MTREEIQDEALKQLESDYSGEENCGKLEIMQDEIDNLKKVVAHLVGWIAQRERLNEAEVEHSTGLLDW